MTGRKRRDTEQELHFIEQDINFEQIGKNVLDMLGNLDLDLFLYDPSYKELTFKKRRDEIVQKLIENEDVRRAFSFSEEMRSGDELEEATHELTNFVELTINNVLEVASGRQESLVESCIKDKVKEYLSKRISAYKHAIQQRNAEFIGPAKKKIIVSLTERPIDIGTLRGLLFEDLTERTLMDIFGYFLREKKIDKAGERVKEYMMEFLESDFKSEVRLILQEAQAARVELEADAEEEIIEEAASTAEKVVDPEADQHDEDPPKIVIPIPLQATVGDMPRVVSELPPELERRISAAGQNSTEPNPASAFDDGEVAPVDHEVPEAAQTTAAGEINSDIKGSEKPEEDEQAAAAEKPEDKRFEKIYDRVWTILREVEDFGMICEDAHYREFSYEGLQTAIFEKLVNDDEIKEMWSIPDDFEYETRHFVKDTETNNFTYLVELAIRIVIQETSETYENKPDENIVKEYIRARVREHLIDKLNKIKPFLRQRANPLLPDEEIQPIKDFVESINQIENLYEKLFESLRSSGGLDVFEYALRRLGVENTEVEVRRYMLEFIEGEFEPVMTDLHQEIVEARKQYGFEPADEPELVPASAELEDEDEEVEQQEETPDKVIKEVRGRPIIKRIVIGAVVVLVLLGGGYLLMRSKKPKEAKEKDKFAQKDKKKAGMSQEAMSAYMSAVPDAVKLADAAVSGKAPIDVVDASLPASMKPVKRVASNTKRGAVSKSPSKSPTKSVNVKSLQSDPNLKRILLSSINDLPANYSEAYKSLFLGQPVELNGMPLSEYIENAIRGSSTPKQWRQYWRKLGRKLRQAYVLGNQLEKGQDTQRAKWYHSKFKKKNPGWYAKGKRLKREYDWLVKREASGKKMRSWHRKRLKELKDMQKLHAEFYGGLANEKLMDKGVNVDEVPSGTGVYFSKDGYVPSIIVKMAQAAGLKVPEEMHTSLDPVIDKDGTQHANEFSGEIMFAETHVETPTPDMSPEVSPDSTVQLDSMFQMEVNGYELQKRVDAKLRPKPITASGEIYIKPQARVASGQIEVETPLTVASGVIDTRDNMTKEQIMEDAADRALKVVMKNNEQREAKLESGRAFAEKTVDSILDKLERPKPRVASGEINVKPTSRVASGVIETRPAPRVASGVIETPRPAPRVASGVIETPRPASRVASGVIETPRPAPRVASGVIETPRPAPRVASGVIETPRPASRVASGVIETKEPANDNHIPMQAQMNAPEVERKPQSIFGRMKKRIKGWFGKKAA